MLLLGQNKLTYLPAEMLNMRLSLFTLSGNPWLKPPTASVDDASEGTKASNPTTPSITRRVARSATDNPSNLSQSSSTTKPITPTTHVFALPSLAELCLRVLLSPHHPVISSVPPYNATIATNVTVNTTIREETVLEALHTLPLPSDYPDSILRELRVCCPRAVTKPDERVLTKSPSKRSRKMERSQSTEEDVFGLVSGPSSQTRSQVDRDEDDEDRDAHPGVGTCMSPIHVDKQAVFVKHAEQRMSWERVIAGIDVGGNSGIPVLWRGCSKGCLNFLDGDEGREL